MDEKIKEGISKVGEGLLNVLTEMQGEDENSVQKSKNNRKKCSRDEDDSCDSNTEKKIKIWTWGIAFVLIVLQVAFLKWWTVLTGVATAFAAYYVAEMLIKMDDIKWLEIPKNKPFYSTLFTEGVFRRKSCSEELQVKENQIQN